MDKFIHKFRKNGKTVTLLRKLCPACGEEYCRELNTEDEHRCSVEVDKDEIYNMKCDEAYDDGR